MADKCVTRYYNTHVCINRHTVESQIQNRHNPHAYQVCWMLKMPSSRFPHPDAQLDGLHHSHYQTVPRYHQTTPSDVMIFQSVRMGKRKLHYLQINTFRAGKAREFFLDNCNLVELQSVSWSSSPYLMAISLL